MTIKVETTADAVWTATGNWTGIPDHVTVWLGSNFLGETSITEPTQLQANDTYTIASGMSIPFTITPRGGTAGQADDAFLAVLADTQNITIALHDGDPGNNHTANELASAGEPGYARVTVTGRIVSA